MTIIISSEQYNRIKTFIDENIPTLPLSKHILAKLTNRNISKQKDVVIKDSTIELLETILKNVNNTPLTKTQLFEDCDAYIPVAYDF